MKKILIYTALFIYLLIGVIFYIKGFISGVRLPEQIFTAAYIIFLWPVPVLMQIINHLF